MNDHKINVKLDIDFSKNNKTLAITETIQSEMYDELRTVRNYIYQLHEEAIHESLIKLGWTPPKQWTNEENTNDIN